MRPTIKLYKFVFYIDNPDVDSIKINAETLHLAMVSFTRIFGIELSANIIEVVRIDIS